MKITTILVTAAVLFLCCLFSGTYTPAISGEQSISDSSDFKISSIVLCDPEDPLCKPCLFFKTSQRMRINVLQNYGKGAIGSYRDLILHFYDQNHNEVLKAVKVEQYVWGPHINDKWLCYLPDTMDSGVYELCIVVKIGNKEYQKSISFSVKNHKDDDTRKEKVDDSTKNTDEPPSKTDDTYELKVDRYK